MIDSDVIYVDLVLGKQSGTDFYLLIFFFWINVFLNIIFSELYLF